MKKALLMVLMGLALVSCKVNVDDDKGSIAVRNESGNENLVITAVYVMEKGTSGYNLVSTCSVKDGRSQFVEQKSGEYSVKVAVTSYVLDVPYQVKYYDTGYNNYRKLKEDGFLRVVFDGSGIYFE